MPKCDFTLYFFTNYTSAWVFSCKFAAYFHILGLSNTFRKKTTFTSLTLVRQVNVSYTANFPIDFYLIL